MSLVVGFKTKHIKGAVRLKFGQYKNGRTSIELYSDGDQGPVPEAKATVNVPEAKLDPDHVLLKGWSENEGIPEALEAVGVVELTGRTVPTGHVHAVEARLLIKEDQNDE